jgi:monofunctional biosynthetic peptidoglycan transglycosylase
MTKKKIAALAFVSLVVAVSAYAFWVWHRLPDVEFLKRQNPKETALMRERGKKRAQEWVRLDRISEPLVDAVLMGEDAGFFGHKGFDLYEIRRAFERNWEEGRTVRGASTITQQLAKNLFLSSERSYGRKLEEALLTRRLEKALGKKRILELYLNVIEWGDGVYGVEAAAQDVFGKSASSLDAAEGALLAAMIPSPLRLQPCERPKSVRNRQQRILRWMHGAGRLTDEEYEAALAERLRLRRCGLFPPEGSALQADPPVRDHEEPHRGLSQNPSTLLAFL